MTLEDVYFISQIAAVVAIIGSLVAIYYQQAQTNRIARAQISQDVSANYLGTLREIMNPELAAIFRKVMFEPEWRRAQRTGIYFHDFVAYVNGRFAKLHPGHDASRPALGTNDPHA